MLVRPVSLAPAALLLAVQVAAAQTPIDATKSGGAAVPAALARTPQATSTGSLNLASSWSDDFNRPNASDLGPDWLLQNGSFAIDANRASVQGSGNQWVQHASASQAYDASPASLDFFAALNPQIQYVALSMGVGASTDNIFVKIQDNNSDGRFDRVFFYRGTNGSPWAPTYFFDITAPTVSGRMTCHFTNGGDTVVAEIDIDFDGNPEDVFSVSGILGANMTLGTAYGVGAFNQPFFDNWNVGGSTPPPVVTYCTAGTSSNGCSPSLGASGQPSASFGSACTLTATSIEGQKSGMIFYGVDNAGFNPVPWAPSSSSFFCVKSPVQRSLPQNSGGTIGQCDGQLVLDWNAFHAQFPGALGTPFGAGDKVYAQAWYRDPPAPRTTNLSDAVELTMLP